MKEHTTSEWVSMLQTAGVYLVGSVYVIEETATVLETAAAVASVDRETRKQGRNPGSSAAVAADSEG